MFPADKPFDFAALETLFPAPIDAKLAAVELSGTAFPTAARPLAFKAAWAKGDVMTPAEASEGLDGAFEEEAAAAAAAVVLMFGERIGRRKRPHSLNKDVHGSVAAVELRAAEEEEERGRTGASCASSLWSWPSAARAPRREDE